MGMIPRQNLRGPPLPLTDKSGGMLKTTRVGE